MTLLEFTLAAMLSLAPGRDHSRLGNAIAREVSRVDALFADDADRRRTASLVIAVAFRESSFIHDAVGDKGQSFCAMQIHRSSGGTPELLEDTDACIRTAMTLLRTSIRVCRPHPIAWYASGPSGCTNERAQRISRDRMALARSLFLGTRR